MNLDPAIFGAPKTERFCTVPKCGRPHYGNGLCGTHSQRVRRGLPLERPVRIRRKADEPRPPCSVRHCTRPVKTSELCAGHYRRKMVAKMPDWARPLKTYRRHGMTKDLSVRLARTAFARLQQDAHSLGRDVSEHVRIMVEEYVARRARGDE